MRFVENVAVRASLASFSRLHTDVYMVDDGSGVLPCAYWKVFPDGDTRPAVAGVELGDAVRVLGKLRTRPPFTPGQAYSR